MIQLKLPFFPTYKKRGLLGKAFQKSFLISFLGLLYGGGWEKGIFGRIVGWGSALWAFLWLYNLFSLKIHFVFLLSCVDWEFLFVFHCALTDRETMDVMSILSLLGTPFKEEVVG